MPQLPYPEVHDLEGAQRNFEQIEAAGMYVGSGAPAFQANAGNYYFRTDTPGAVYVCTGGSAWDQFAAKLPVFYVPPPSGDTTGASDGAAITSALAALALLSADGAGVLQFQGGIYYDNTPRDLHGTVGVIVQGCGGLSGGASPVTQINYVGTGARYLNARSTSGFELRDLMIIATNAAFTGNLVDLSHDPILGTDSNLFKLADCFLSIAAAASGTVVYCDQAVDGLVWHCNISNGTYGVQGVGAAGHYSNAITIAGRCRFGGQTGAAILNPGQGWEIVGNTFELGTAPAVASTLAAPSQNGGVIAGNWTGDAGGSQVVFQIGTGVSVRGNYIGGNANTTGVEVLVGTIGTEIVANSFITHSLGIKIDGGSDLKYWPNFYTGVTTRHTAPTAAALSGAGTGATVAVASGSNANSVSVNVTTGTAPAAGQIFSVTLPAGRATSTRAIVQGHGSSALNLTPYVWGWSGNTVTIAVENAPAANTTYTFVLVIPEIG